MSTDKKVDAGLTIQLTFERRSVMSDDKCINTASETAIPQRSSNSDIINATYFSKITAYHIPKILKEQFQTLMEK